jgi:hypothetical protein
MGLLALSGQDFGGVRSRVPEFESSLRRLGLERAGRQRRTVVRITQWFFPLGRSYVNPVRS